MNPSGVYTCQALLVYLSIIYLNILYFEYIVMYTNLWLNYIFKLISYINYDLIYFSKCILKVN